MSFTHRTLPSFWQSYSGLSEDIQGRAVKQFELLSKNPAHPSIQLKAVGAFWSARVTDSYRSLAIREENTFVWFWIGNHDDYERLLKG